MKRFLYMVFACILCNACTDNEMYTSVEGGIPVEISFDLSIPGMDQITTRGLDEASESKVNDLYILIFSTNGQLISHKFYPTEEIISTLENKRNGSLKLQTISGDCRIYAVANVETTELGKNNILNQLESVENINQFFKITAELPEASVERIQAALTMSGPFVRNGIDNGIEGFCTIPDNGGKLNGKIQLSRLDSHITFKIATGIKIKSFTPTSWQVKNVPLKSAIYMPTPEQNLFRTADCFANSKISTGFGTNKSDGITFRTFDFYMLENIKFAKKDEDGSSINPNVIGDELKKEYAKREAEKKNTIASDENGNPTQVQNSGIYKYSDEFATFVEIKGSLEIENEGSMGGIRVATVTYRIHLGGGTSNPDIFTSLRNTKYTYLMKIEDVNDIIVEVEKDQEVRPGAEGDVVDAKAEVRTLDAHYNCFVMGFSYKDVITDSEGTATPNLKFVVKTPFGQITESSEADKDGSTKKQDYHWINFKSNGATNDATKMQIHKGDMIDLFGLAQNVLDRYNEDPQRSKDKLYYYTVFVDEYYYNEAPAGQNWGSDPANYWRYFANAENRYAMLVYAPKYSLDGNSSYASARYMITQRSIQTYYSTESDIALGMEHTNENGFGKWGSPNISDISSANGLWNTWNYIKKNTSWESHVTRTDWDQDMNTFTTKDDALVLARCLSRNRDENGDGTITLDEVKWYVPTSEQLMGMYLGAESLPSPLHDANNISFVYSNRGDFHYGTSDQKRIWSEEGASVSGFADNWGAGDKPRNFRCVRNLGIDKKKSETLKKSEYPKEAFEYKASNTLAKIYDPTSTSSYKEVSVDNVFSMTRLTEQNIRGRINRGEIAIHNNFENGNKPYKAFQMAKDLLTPENTKVGGTRVTNRDNGKSFTLTTWDVVVRSYWYERQGGWPGTNYLTTDGDQSLCKNYSEETNQKDKGLWRAPNQREMMLMYIQDISYVNGTTSRTEWKYEGSERKFCTNSNLYLSNNADKTARFSLRCVRDIELVK